VSAGSRSLRATLGLLALAAASTLATLGVFEVALRWMGYEPIYAVYSHPEIFWQKDPLLGWAHTPNSEAVYVGPRPWPVEFEAPVRINSLGLRGPEIAELPENGYRIMVLGDSLVAAFEVPWQQTFSALLEAEMKREFDLPVQVINAGVRGYGTDQSYLYYKERGSLLRPDLVIFIHGANDPADNITLHRMRRIFSKGALSPRSDGDLDPTGYPIPDYPLCSEYVLDASYHPRRVDSSFESALCTAQTVLADRSALFTFLSNRIRLRPDLLILLYKLGSPDEGAEVGTAQINAGLPPEEWNRLSHEAPRFTLTAGILHALVREVRANGSELILPVIPKGWAHLDATEFRSDGVTTVDIEEDLERREVRYEHDSHMNPYGHALIARLLAPSVADHIRAHLAHRREASAE